MNNKKIISVLAIICLSWLNFFVYWQNERISEYNPSDLDNTKTYADFDNTLSFWDWDPVSGLNLPWMDTEWFQWDEPIVLVKDLIYKVIELLPFIVFVMLLLWCFHMIVSIKDWEWKKWSRIIKQVILGTILFIISIYVLNVVSIYISWAPIISKDRIFHTYMWWTDYTWL